MMGGLGAIALRLGGLAGVVINTITLCLPFFTTDDRAYLHTELSQEIRILDSNQAFLDVFLQL